MSANLLRDLFRQLKGCPGWNNRFEGEFPRLTWEKLKALAWQPHEEIPTAVIAALVLHDDTFAELLDETERSQMRALARKAVEQYLRESNPPQQLGNLIATTLEEL